MLNFNSKTIILILLSFIPLTVFSVEATITDVKIESLDENIKMPPLPNEFNFFSCPIAYSYFELITKVWNKENKKISFLKVENYNYSKNIDFCLMYYGLKKRKKYDYIDCVEIYAKSQYFVSGIANQGRKYFLVCRITEPNFNIKITFDKIKMLFNINGMNSKGEKIAYYYTFNKKFIFQKSFSMIITK